MPPPGRQGRSNKAVIYPNLIDFSGWGLCPVAGPAEALRWSRRAVSGDKSRLSERSLTRSVSALSWALTDPAREHPRSQRRRDPARAEGARSRPVPASARAVRGDVARPVSQRGRDPVGPRHQARSVSARAASGDAIPRPPGDPTATRTRSRRLGRDPGDSDAIPGDSDAIPANRTRSPATRTRSPATRTRRSL